MSLVLKLGLDLNQNLKSKVSMRIVIYRINYYRQLSADIKMKNYKIVIQFYDFILKFL